MASNPTTMSDVAPKAVSPSQSLKQQLAGMESAFHAAPIGLCVLDLDFRYVTVNACFSAMYGLREVDFIGRSVQEALPEPAPQIMAHLEAALRYGGIVQREICLQNPASTLLGSDSNEVVYLRTAQPVRDDRGQTIGISVALLDITARKKLEATLAESEDDLRYTVELTPHIPWTADGTGEVTFMSSKWHAMTGKSPGRISLRYWAESLHPEDRDKTKALWAESVLTGESYDAEYRIRAADHTWRWVRARAYPRRSSGGEIVRWYGTVEDIHDRKTMFMLLQEATEQLSRKSTEDYLTGLRNRRYFDEIIGREMDRARRSDTTLSLVLLDVDHFKMLNDVAGHLAGDECLRQVAKALESVIRRPADCAARFGGEEFALILPETNLSGALTIANNALASVRTLFFRNLDSRVQRVSVSAGAAEYKSRKDETRDRAVEHLIAACDAALYKAKAAGRDLVCCADA